MTTGYNYLPPPLIRPPAPVWQPAEDDRPVYVDPQPLRTEDKPEQIDRHGHVQALAAAHHARKLYPGPVGEVLANEIESYKTLGCIAQPSAPVVRLIAELTAGLGAE